MTDASGAVVSSAAITVANVGTGIQTSLDADQGGNFVASAVPFGTYVVTVHASGFAETKSQQIVLNVGATVHSQPDACGGRVAGECPRQGDADHCGYLVEHVGHDSGLKPGCQPAG